MNDVHTPPSLPTVPLRSDLTLGVTGNAVCFRDGRWWTHHSFGRIVDLLAKRLRGIRYHAPLAPEAAAGTFDYPFEEGNVSVHPWRTRRNTFRAMLNPWRLLREYRELATEVDALLVRGSAPLVWIVHKLARRREIPIVHWVIGNPHQLLKTQPRGYGRILQKIGVAFASMEQRLLLRSARLSGAYILCNGMELAQVFHTPKTLSVISTSIYHDDFFVRPDTCTGEHIRALFVGFIRPEKGLEYLLRALPLVRAGRPVHLAIVGSWEQFPAEHRRLSQLARELGITGSVTWEGYAPFGDALFSQMDRSDLLVLPSLSEGTPRVLVEARARSLPLISTTVGGIPSSVSHEEDGLLVPPADAESLAAAITRLVDDGPLRRRLIERGRQRVANWTIDRFVDLVFGLLTLRNPPVALIATQGRISDQGTPSIRADVES